MKFENAIYHKQNQALLFLMKYYNKNKILHYKGPKSIYNTYYFCKYKTYVCWYGPFKKNCFPSIAMKIKF